ncbi:MAG: DUF4381 domain-containing protein [Pseudomonadales bacterium]
MDTDVLQQLRDIHLPADPSWWPPAPGWWLLALLVLLALALLARRLRRALRARLPLRRARQLYAGIHARYRAGELSDVEYVHASNELLKRVFVHGLDRPGARRASGAEWLALLDRELGTSEFSTGPGRVLGDARFAPRVDVAAAELDDLIVRLLRSVGPGADA